MALILRRVGANGNMGITSLDAVSPSISSWQRVVPAEYPARVSEPNEASPPLRVHLVLVFVSATFGLMHVVAKGVLESLEPLQLAGLRALAASPLLLWMAWRHDRIVPSRADLPMLALLGGLGVFLNQVLFIVGLDHTTASNAAILMPSIPVFAIAIGAALGIEGIGPRRLAGVALTVGGCLALLDPTRFDLARETAVGNLLILLNCLSYAAFLVVQRPILRRVPWRTVIAWAFLFGTVGILLTSGRSLTRLEPAAVPFSAWLGLAFIVLFPTFLGYALSTWAVRRSTPSLVAIYTTTQPLVAALAAITLLGESVGVPELIGFVLISGGVLIAGRSQTRQLKS